jgi:predicted RNA-binding protein YlxR (DUF448 family)
MRKCTGCLEMKNKKELIRVVKAEDVNGEAEFSLDYGGKKSGRGAYICPSLSCLETAHKKKGFERSFKQAVPVEVYEQLRRALEKNGP